MSIIMTIVMGFIVGLFARAIMPGRDALGFILTTLLGIGGALIGKFLGEFIGMYRETETAGFFMSLFGAMILLYIYKVVVRKTTPPTEP